MPALGSTAAAVDPVSLPSGLVPFVARIVPVLDSADSSLPYPDLAWAWRASYGVVAAVVAVAVAAAVVVVGAFAVAAALKAGFASAVAVAAAAVVVAVAVVVVAAVVAAVADYASSLASVSMTEVLAGRMPAGKPHPLALRLLIHPVPVELPSLFASLS